MEQKQKLHSKRHVIRLSIGLFIFNLVLGGLAIADFTNQSKDTIRTQDQGVLGTQRTIPTFDKNFIMSNQTFTSTRAFPNADSVQNYLSSMNSPLANYSPQGQRASTWIYNAARGISSSKYGITVGVNPGVILAYLEKEQGLLSVRNYDINSDPEKRIKYAMGYGCPDTAACDQQFNGFVNQVNWGAYQLQYNFNNATNSRTYPYNVNNTITTLDGYSVYMTNEATVAQYRYTPHVYWGNYNLWKIIVANGWGVSSDTFTYQEIDSLNLPNKDNGPTTTIVKPPDNGEPKITTAQVKELLQKKYTIGETGESIKTLQKFLRQEGYFTNTEITGEYGVITDNALSNYRIDKGIAIKNEVTQNDRCKQLILSNYSIGTENTEISELQKCLQSIGLFNWPLITGYFGPVTKKGQEAARSSINSQNSNLNKVNKILPPGASQSSPVSTCNDLKSQQFQYGEQSNRVEQLQKCLQEAGLFSWKYGITGYFGPVTQEAYSKWKGKTTVSFDCNDLKSQTWANGETSERVKQLQTCMKQAGVFNFAGGATGYFGSVTDSSLKKWRGY
jgi:peptidoglycan hydrolase-like protein with peptidoglycan-binding domain